MQSMNADPFDWTVDEVVNFLCHDPHTPWSRSSSQPPRPDSSSFEALLRENLITGEVLLQDVDKQALRDDLGLKALGHRSCIMMAIRFLQNSSPKFQESVAHTHTLWPDHMPSPGIMSPPPVHSAPQDATPRPTHMQRLYSTPAGGPQLIPPTPVLGTSVLSKPLGIEVATYTRIPNDGTADFIGSGQGVSHGDSPFSSLRKSTENPHPRPSRPQEYFIVDSQGRKRRRLDLTSFAESPGQRLALESPDNRQTKIKNWYMGPEPIKLSQLFYPSDPVGDDQTFSFISPNTIPTAQRSFVNKRLSHFFKQSPIKLPPNQSHPQWAVIPYKSLTLKAGSPSFFTLYTAKDGAVNVSKEKVEEWPQLRALQEVDKGALAPTESLKPSDPFSYLLQKYPVQETPEDAHPLYGDSGSEGEFDEETWEEIEDERSGPLPSKQTKLGPTEVDSIIKECISEFENIWREKSLPKEKYKARNIWLIAKKGNRTNQEIKAIAKDVALLEARLRKLQDAIHKSEYTTDLELRTQCQSLEYTISNIQKQKWRASVLEQPTCPLKIPAPSRPQYQRKTKNMDEESLDSESDVVSTFSFGDFIDDRDMTELPPPPSPSSSDGDDYDIISVSGIRRRTRPRRASFLTTGSSSPAPPEEMPDVIDVIDLTMESPEPDELTIETPPLNPFQSTNSTALNSTPPGGTGRNSISPGPNLTEVANVTPVKAENGSPPSLPKTDDMDSILLLPWELLEERQDRSRLLSKLIGSLSNEERQRLRERIPQYEFTNLRSLTRTALKLLRKSQENIPRLDSEENQVIMRTASLYISWINCVQLRQRGIRKKYVRQALRENSFDVFYGQLCKRLERSRSWEQRRASVDLEPEVDSISTPHKKRKREVKESQAVKMTQANAQLRAALQEKQKMKLEKKLESMGLSNDNPNRQPVTFKDPIIYLDPHIGSRLKPHQLNGIQFMWRELIEDKNQQGCLLAHTMGLGKTMQVISFLCTISAAAASDDPRVRQQIPEAFRRSQTLILCPSSLIDNWNDEFLMWAPGNSGIGLLRKISSSSSSSLSARLKEVSNWYKEGGVLLISYGIFRSWVMNKETSKRGKPLSNSDYQNIRKWLLDGPNIIVADEAHTMKNPATAISAATVQFRSKSRVALTGSPLANNLADYYAMVNWIAEGYLGSSVEFKAHYIEPIEEGMYVDSTYAEKRKSLKRLQVLKEILDPKINRADISVLEGSLPPKVEFVITVPLSKIQKAAYDSYVAFILQGGRNDDLRTAKLWTWLAILGLCCNHPACFMEKLCSRAEDATRKLGGPDADQVPGDEPITQAGLPDLAKLVSEQREIFKNVSDMMALELSARSEILNRIIDESIKAGDKVLVFSQSLPTLGYIESTLKSCNRRYHRLDGQTPISSRQEATKRFNKGTEQQVYLISTRAGGLGLNIPGANRVVIFDFSFSPIWEEQAVGRAYRLGQKKPVYVYRFIAGGTFEEIIHHKAVFKTQLAVRVVDKKNPVRAAYRKLGDYLFPAKPVVQQDVSEFRGKDPLVLDKILNDEEKNEDRLIRSITLTETFQKDDNDNLTEEERRDVQQELDDELLKRTDPNAYREMMYERQKQQQVYIPTTPYPVSFVPQAFPHIAHNAGPPALAPDMSILQSSSHNTAGPAPFPPPPVPQLQMPAAASSELLKRQLMTQLLPQTQQPEKSPDPSARNNDASDTATAQHQEPSPGSHSDPSTPNQEDGGGCRTQ